MISGALFLAADIFAVTSLAMPQWIVSDIGGSTKIGLLKTCLTVYGRQSICFAPDPVRGEWLLTFVCIMLGVLCISVTVIFLILSYWQFWAVKFARWMGFLAMTLLCLAAIIFPIGFDMDQIGGEAYQLPNNFRVGISYIFFVLSLWITVVSQLFASRVCLPHF